MSLTVQQAYDRAYRLTIQQDELNSRAGLPTLACRDRTPAERADSAAYWLGWAAQGDVGAWEQLLVHAVSAVVALDAVKVVQVHSGSEDS